MPLEAARALVPWWVVPAAALAHAAAAAAFACAVGALLFTLGRRAIAWRAPWPLRARRLCLCRLVLDAAFLVFSIPMAFLIPSQRFLVGAPAISAIAAFLLVLGFWRARLTRAVVGEDYTLRRAVAGFAARTTVLCPQLWTVLPVAIAMPSRADATAALFLVAALLLPLAIPFVQRLVSPAPPEIARAVMDAAAKQGIRLAGVSRIDLPEANAYALPFARRIAFTRAALQKIDRPALLALAQLEALRLREPGRRAWTCAAVLLALAPVFAAKAAGVPMIAAAIVATALANALCRRPFPLDARFDREAAGAETGPGAYARALVETHRLHLVPAVLRAATGQPNLHDRLIALGWPLPYPRPRAPSIVLYIASVALVGILSVAAGTWGSFAALLAGNGSWTAAVLSARDDRFASPIGDLAYARHAERRYDDAALLYGAAAALEPRDPVWPAHQSMSLAAAGRIEDANRALAAAERLGAEADLVAATRERIERKR